MKKIAILIAVVAAFFAGAVGAQDSKGDLPVGGAEPTIACTLSPQDLATRKEDVLTPLKEAVLEKKDIEKGIELTFQPEHFGLVTRFIESENGCCSFFKFTLTVGPGNKPLRLIITGPPAAKELLLHWL